MRILVVEDDEGQAKLLSSVLSASQPEFQSTVATCLKEACSELEHRRFDAVLLDLNLPDSRELATLDAVRACSPIPLVVFTGAADLGDQAIARGADDYLVKGEANPRAVRRALSHAIQRRRLHAAEETIDQQLILLDSARDAILVCTLDGRIRFWNAGATRLYGWTAPEAIGRDVFDLLTSGGTALDYIRKQTAEKGEWSGELRQVSRGGREITVESRWSRVTRSGAPESSLLIINTDVTERKRLEAELLRAQRFESLGTLAGALAHDLSDILLPITLGTNILRQKLSDPDLLPTIETVHSSAQRASELMGQLMVLGKGRAVERKLIDPAAIVADVERVVRQTLPPGVGVDAAIADDLWPVWCDRAQVQQVLLTLLLSVREAVGAHGTIVVGCQNVEIDETFAAMFADAKPGTYSMFRVENRGAGLPEELRARIFDSFYTAGPIESGRALDLATASSIVRNHGGFIRVESEHERGTLFYVYLPAAANISAIDETGPSLVRPGRGDLVLVIDDDESVREITRAALQANGFHVLSAGDGAEGVAVFAREQAAVRAVIVDVAMPVMDGLATVRAIRWLDPQARIVVMSGLATPPNGELGALATDVLLKPFTADQLLLAVQNALASEEEHRQLQ